MKNIFTDFPLLEKLIVLCVVSGTVAIIIYLNQKKTRIRMRKQEAQLQRMKTLLYTVKHQLDTTVRTLTEKNELESLQQNKAGYKDVTILSELKHYIILTEDDWSNFQQLFEKVKPGVIANLNERYPNLSSADLRYILLSMLNFSHKEMAASLGISVDSLRVTWHRLRKKLNIPATTTIQEFIIGLNNDSKFRSAIQKNIDVHQI